MKIRNLRIFLVILFDLSAVTLPWVLVIHVAAFYRFGLYRGMWRFASLPDLKRILLVVGQAARVVEYRPPAE